MPAKAVSPALHVCLPSSTPIALHTFAPCKAFHPKTHRALPTVSETVHGRCQDRRLELGPVRSAVSMCMLCCDRTIMPRLDTTSAGEQASRQIIEQYIIGDMFLSTQPV